MATRYNAAPTPLAVGVEQVPGLTGIPRTTVFQMIREGELASVKVGRRRLVLIDTLKQVLKQRERRGIEAEEAPK